MFILVVVFVLIQGLCGFGEGREGGLLETNLSLSFLQLAFQIAFRLSEDLTSVRKLKHILFNEKAIK